MQYYILNANIKGIKFILKLILFVAFEIIIHSKKTKCLF